MNIPSDLLPSLLAVLSAFLFALSIQIQNLGLQSADPRTATLVSISATAIVYWIISPLYLETSYWLTSATLLFAGVGLFRPVLSQTLAIKGIKTLGPSLTSGLAATTPLFAAGFAIILLDESITLSITLGTGAVILGVVVSSLKPGGVNADGLCGQFYFPLALLFFEPLGIH